MVGDYRGSYSRSSDSEFPDDTYSVEEETTSSVYSAGKEYMTREWTDEKHSLYLKSMEASFVDQLYTSLGLIGSKENVPETGPSRKFDNIRNSSQDQVLRDGFWQKTNVKQPEYSINERNGDSRDFLNSQWIKHYKPLPKNRNPVVNECCSEQENQMVSSNVKKGIVICSSRSASCLDQTLRAGCSHLRDRDQISIGDEVSDQNFVNEGANGSSKKMKTVMSGSSSTDQVVPLGKSPTT